MQSLTFVCHGARLGIRAHDLCVLERASGLLPPAARIETLTQIDAWYELSGGGGEPGNPRPHRLQSGSELIASSVEFEPVLHELASSLHFVVARYARGSLYRPCRRRWVEGARHIVGSSALRITASITTAPRRHSSETNAAASD